MRLMTDLTAERYWTVVAETQVEHMDRYTEMSRKSMEIKEVQEAMKGLSRPHRSRPPRDPLIRNFVNS